jgi:site-specific DNA-methyltransferase (adenine-specific)
MEYLDWSPPEQSRDGISSLDWHRNERVPANSGTSPSQPLQFAYYSKGKPKTFRRIRTPILKCRHCEGEVKDYGGHRDAMNPKGVTLKDVWTDIPPVRHWKFKSKNREANALSTKILDHVVEMSTIQGDIVLDPFGGSGTTFAVCEAKERHWIGMEIDYAKEIIERLEGDAIQSHRNDDFVDD